MSVLAKPGRVAAARDDETPYPPLGYAAYAVAILMLTTVLSLTDRHLPSLLVGPIRQAFAVSDVQVSLLQGLAFAILYSIMGLPFGRLVDRTHRRNIIVAGLLLWSAMTFWSGLANSFTELLIARVGVGVGEACLAPAAYSIIADYFAPQRRARALAVYFVSIAAGGGLSLLLGAFVLHSLPGEAVLTLPLLGPTPQWQVVFLVAGLPGLPLALLLLTVREPARREQAGAAHPSIGDFFRHMRAHRATFLFLIGAHAVVVFVGYAMAPWAPTFFVRRFEVSMAQSGLLVGLVTAIAGPIGYVASGILSDRWVAAGVPAARLRIAAYALALAAPAIALWPLTGDIAASVVLLGLALLFLGAAMASAPPAIQDVVPNRMRGQAVALYMALGTLFGAGLGPSLTALATEHLFGGAQGLRYSLVVVPLPAVLLALAGVVIGLRPYARTRTALTAQL